MYTVNNISGSFSYDKKIMRQHFFKNEANKAMDQYIIESTLHQVYCHGQKLEIIQAKYVEEWLSSL